MTSAADKLQALARCAHRIRRYAVRMGEVQGQGYIGQALGWADVLAVAYGHALHLQPQNPEWEGRDRFLLSHGHYAIAHYAALIEAGVSRVVAAMRDPFPKVDGGGFDLLRNAGIEVAEGLMATQARELNKGFLSRVERNRPWLRVKLAASLDGRTAMADGSSKWITGPAAREDVQHWRARAGAILTGADTVLADDPMLTVRLADTEVMPPLRVVLDSRLRSLECGRVREGGAPTLYLHDAAVSAPDAADAEFASVPSAEGRLDLGAVLALLAERGINEVHTEAGATLAGALLRGGWVDELLLYQAPTLLGDNGRPLLAGLGIDAMDQQHRLRVVDQRQVGEDIRLLLRP